MSKNVCFYREKWYFVDILYFLGNAKGMSLIPYSPFKLRKILTKSTQKEIRPAKALFFVVYARVQG